MVDPSKKVPDLKCEVPDLLLEVVGLKQEVPDLRSGGIPLNLTPGYHSHKWLTNDYHCAKQKVLHDISMRLSSRLELRSAPSKSELELLVGLGIGMADPRNGGALPNDG